MDFSDKIYEALENLDQEKVKSLVDSDESDNGMLSVEMISRALDMEQEDMAILMLMALYRHYSLTDDSSHRLVSHAAHLGFHNFLRMLVTLDNGHLLVAGQVLQELHLGRMATVVQGSKMHNSQLHTCVLNGEPVAMMYLYALAGVPVNAQNKVGDTALHVAVGEESAEMVEALLQCGVNPMLRNKLGQTAADAALQANNRTLADLLHSYEPGLTWGLERSDARAVVTALRRWVSPHSLLDASAGGRTGLMLGEACGLGPRCGAGPGLVFTLLLVHRVLANDLRGVRAMLGQPELAACLNVNLRHRDNGMSPLAAAVRNHNDAMTLELLKNGAVVNTRVYNAPLVSMALKWMTPFPLVRALFEADAVQSEACSVWDERDPDGLTPFLRAVQCGRSPEEVAQLLSMCPGRRCLAHRAADGQQNARELAVELGRWEVVQVIDAAVRRLFVGVSRSDEARAALMRLAIAYYGRENFEAAAEDLRGQPDVERFLANLEAVEAGGVALMRAVVDNDYAGVKSLNQADFVDKNGYSALTRAVVLDRLEIAEWLVAERPQLKFVGDNENCYPLHYAYALPQEASDKYVSLLSARDPDILLTLCDKDGNIPCTYKQLADSAQIQMRLERVAKRGVLGSSQ